jgi:hypothetical protein
VEGRAVQGLEPAGGARLQRHEHVSGVDRPALRRADGTVRVALERGEARADAARPALQTDHQALLCKYHLYLSPFVLVVSADVVVAVVHVVPAAVVVVVVVVVATVAVIVVAVAPL